jgi:hypothetical protein
MYHRVKLPRYVYTSQGKPNHRRQTKKASSPGVGLLYNNKIHDLDLPYGLIELALENNFTLRSLMNIGSSELSKTVGIDQEVAALICKAAKDKKKINQD